MIRQATIHDAREIARIHVTGWKTAYAGIVPQAYLDSLSIEGRTSRFRRKFAEYGDRYLVYEADSRLKGFVIQGPTLDEDCPGIHEIQALYVEPASWRQGVGTRLVREAERAMLECGMADITLWVFRDNHLSWLFRCRGVPQQYRRVLLR